jgi:hypothetical protein
VDSISSGRYDRRGGWVARLWGSFVTSHGAPQHYIYNMSDNGDTTGIALRRSEPEAERKGIEDY